MTDWARVPVLVGGGQVTNREEDPARAPDPFELMESASLAAARSAVGTQNGEAESLLARLTHCYMVHSLSLRHGNPAQALADRLGATEAQARCSGMGGSIPQWLVNRAAEQVVAGDRPVILVAGAEALATRKRAKREGVQLDWPASDGWPETWPPIEPDLGVHKAERAHGLDQATTMYALIESAVSHRLGHDQATHRDAMGTLMARFNEVAATNPYSWFPQARSAAEIMTVTADNRMIFHPYTKYVNAVMDVDMAAAAIVTDAATARQWGLGPYDVAYLTGWADAKDIWFLSQRPDIERSPALAACAEVACASAGIELADVGAFDLYSCFPSSIEVARDTFGIAADDQRLLTLTGGLPYHGGPGSNYVTHAIVNALEHLRSGTSDHVLVHGNGYYLTKHSVGIYGRRPPAEASIPDEKLQDRLDAELSPLEVHRAPSGPATVVAYTVPYDRDGRTEPGIVLVDVGVSGGRSGGRALAKADEALTDLLVSGDAVGTAVTMVPGKSDEAGKTGPNAAVL